MMKTDWYFSAWVVALVFCAGTGHWLAVALLAVLALPSIPVLLHYRRIGRNHAHKRPRQL